MINIESKNIVSRLQKLGLGNLWEMVLSVLLFL